MNYSPQLDGLRAIAVIMVTVNHWLQLKTWWFSGAIGVQLFFVLSGFLITSILLNAREQALAHGYDKRRIIGNFFIRRVLRIFPIYYATLITTYAIGIDAVRDTVGWHVLYLSNVFFALRGAFYAQVSHFWSLSVEEQFYFIWPFLILFLSACTLPRMVLTFILIGPLFRLFGALTGLNSVAIEVLPFASFDSLGIGALLAWLRMDGAQLGTVGRLREYFRFPYWVVIIALAILTCQLLLVESGTAGLRRFFMAPVLGVVVFLAYTNRLPKLTWLLSLRPIVWLGKRSYSVYVFHFFVPHVLASTDRRLELGFIQGLSQLGFFALCFLVLIGVSALSWRFFEHPINQLKRHFPYVAKNPVR